MPILCRNQWVRHLPGLALTGTGNRKLAKMTLTRGAELESLVVFKLQVFGFLTELSRSDNCPCPHHNYDDKKYQKLPFDKTLVSFETGSFLKV